MKKILTCLLVPGFMVANAQKHKLVQLWSTDAVVATPESVLPDTKDHKLYISLIDGGPWDADGKGGIGRLTDMGTQYDSLWFTGLNAPKGLVFTGINVRSRYFRCCCDRCIICKIDS
jgi:hypothetical protein